jgi:DNA-binding response OmpR family regulator
MNISKILVIEDDEEINDLIYNTLKNENYNMVQAFDGKDALEKYNNTFQLIILDLMLPYVDGIEVLRKIREKSTVPIIILSAKDEETDRVIGLSMGADDYMIKPFSTRELAARVKAQLRRCTYYNRTNTKNSTLQCEELKLDISNHTVFKKDKKLNLTPKEFELLKFFLKNPDRVFTKAQIFNGVWENDYLHDDNTVMVHIKRLRNKIEDDPNTPKYIVTVWGIGYKLGE